jgi:hypothetical protein
LDHFSSALLLGSFLEGALGIISTSNQARVSGIFGFSRQGCLSLNG